jgi:hypothetical protein
MGGTDIVVPEVEPPVPEGEPPAPEVDAPARDVEAVVSVSDVEAPVPEVDVLRAATFDALLPQAETWNIKIPAKRIGEAVLALRTKMRIGIQPLFEVGAGRGWRGPQTAW